MMSCGSLDIVVNVMLVDKDQDDVTWVIGGASFMVIVKMLKYVSNI